MISNSVMIHATIDDSEERYTRYEFVLSNNDSESFNFIIDIPENGHKAVDVWVTDSVVHVGDTPDDGFATFYPRSVREWTYDSTKCKYTDLPHDYTDTDANHLGWCAKTTPVAPADKGKIAEEYYCTRRRGHTGRHAAGDCERILAVWSAS